jgi:hypothetical protein
LFETIKRRPEDWCADSILHQPNQPRILCTNQTTEESCKTAGGKDFDEITFLCLKYIKDNFTIINYGVSECININAFLQS